MCRVSSVECRVSTGIQVRSAECEVQSLSIRSAESLNSELGLLIPFRDNHWNKRLKSPRLRDGRWKQFLHDREAELVSEV